MRVHDDLTTRQPHALPTRRSSDLKRCFGKEMQANEPAGENSGGGRRAGDPPPACRGAGASRRRIAGSSSTTDRKSTRLNSSHVRSSYAVFCLKQKNRVADIWPAND